MQVADYHGKASAAGHLCAMLVGPFEVAYHRKEVPQIRRCNLFLLLFLLLFLFFFSCHGFCRKHFRCNVSKKSCEAFKVWRFSHTPRASSKPLSSEHSQLERTNSSLLCWTCKRFLVFSTLLDHAVALSLHTSSVYTPSGRHATRHERVAT